MTSGGMDPLRGEGTSSAGGSVNAVCATMISDSCVLGQCLVTETTFASTWSTNI